MTIESENSFLDTNILLYAYDVTAGEKHKVAMKLVYACMQGTTQLAISSQILGEFLSVGLRSSPYDKIEIERVINDIISLPNWLKFSYTEKTIQKAMHQFLPGFHFWDLVIAQTMLENGITMIYTENTKDFAKIPGIKAVNPFE